MFSGYVFTSDGRDALALMGTQGVRYVAEMSDGTGFAAFDSEDPIGDGSMAVSGWIVTAMEPHPDYPPSWPKHPDGPKRQIGTGDERFSLYAASDRKYLHVPRAAAWVTDGLRPLLLVEVGPDYPSDVSAIWTAEVISFLDARVMV
jgi:hypothetical protein